MLGRRREENRLARHADQLRQEYRKRIDRGDLEAALRIGDEELLPVAEQLAETNPQYLGPLAMTLRNLATLCQRLDRPVTALWFVQHAFHATMDLRSRGLAVDPSLGDVHRVTADVATRLAEAQLSRATLAPVEQKLVVPVEALVPRSIELLGQLNGFAWACRLRIAATHLTALSYHGEMAVVDYESTSMVWLARLGAAGGDRAFALAEIREALQLWTKRLNEDQRYWSTQLARTWTVAADLLDSLGSPRPASSIRAAVRQAVNARQSGLGLSDMARALDLREHYRAALAALT